ncbi:hypothetical protein AX17_004006 [Amanita inopinata Kibby_2008]|nr:hypothetical protein AX17_004006 [Amanita inopinata Kibby_2008]
MSLYNYLDSPNSNLICCICRNPFVDPATTTTCSHTFCYECIINAISHAPQCPIDRSPLTTNDLGPADPIICSLVDELTVECMHREEGCLHTCQRQLLPAHLRDECLYGEVQCQEAECSQRMMRKSLDAHTRNRHGHSISPETFSIKSDNDSEANPSDTVSHCTHSKNGCPFSTQDQMTLYEHIRSCAYEGVKEFFALSSARHASLVDQNLILRHRISALETSVQILRREMETVRRALGPWFRSEAGTVRTGRRGLHVPSMSLESSVPAYAAGILNPLETENMSQRESTPTTSNGEALTISDTFRQVSGSFSTTGNIRDVSSAINAFTPYFPTFDGDNVETGGSRLGDALARGHSRVTPSSSVLGSAGPLYHETYIPLGFSLGVPPLRVPGPPPHLAAQTSTSTRPLQAAGNVIANLHLSSMVAPLDLGTTLEGTLSGLRESMMALAAGVDSLGRRSEIALTNESLRFGEEIMSLRASVNGLRMQVLYIVNSLSELSH